jgi:hypothetical protein
MKTKKEILTKYSDGHFTQFKGYENILMAMQEYADQGTAHLKKIIEKQDEFIKALLDTHKNLYGILNLPQLTPDWIKEFKSELASLKEEIKND